MRKRIYEIIEKAEKNDRISEGYDLLMIVTLVVSLVPLAFKHDTTTFDIIDNLALLIFLIDYVLRWITADLRHPERGKAAFVSHPFTPMAIIDLISILPSFLVIRSSIKTVRILRVVRTVRILSVFKTRRYSKNFIILENMLKEVKEPLLVVISLAVSYILISALVIFNVEPEMFRTYFDAVYWATQSLTTVGYGDIVPVTTAGKLIVMLSSFFGIAVVALPAGIFTAGYMKQITNARGGFIDIDDIKKEDEEKDKPGFVVVKEERKNDKA